MKKIETKVASLLLTGVVLIVGALLLRFDIAFGWFLWVPAFVISVIVGGVCFVKMFAMSIDITKEDWEKATGRVDHNLTGKDTLFYRLSFHDRVFPSALHLPAPAFGGGYDGTVRGWNTGMHFTHIFSPSAIVRVQAAWNYARFTRSNPAAAGEANLNAKHGVPGTMPIRIVELLEVIDVDKC